MPPARLRKQRRVGVEPPIDVAHLARQTLGQHSLQREVLGLFLSHTAEQMPQLRNAASAAERRAVAHAINGAARNIGAWEVARIAGEIEAESGDQQHAVDALELAFDEARTHIGFLIEG